MSDDPARTLDGTGKKAPADSAQLIESIYRVTLEPDTYDAFMGRWDDFIQDRLTALGELRDASSTLNAPDIARHFEIAEKLLEKTRTVGAAQSQTLTYGRGSTNPGADPKFMIDTTGSVVWSNAAASRLLGMTRSTKLADLVLSDHHRAALNDHIGRLQSAHETGDPPLIFQMQASAASDGLAVGDVLHLQARRLREKLGDDLLLVSPLVASWPPGMPGLLGSSFGLSQSECEICELLSRAHRPVDIAEFRGRTIATVRTQIKSLLVKTGCTSQTELVRLLHLLMRVAEDHGPSHPAAPIAQGEMMMLKLASGQLLTVEMHGPADGKPVIFLHGMLDGASLTTATRAALAARGYRFICPTRPWFGDAQPDYGAIEEAPARIGGYVREMCERLDLQGAIAVGHMAGAVYAFAAAQAAPDHIRGVVNVAGGVPIVSTNQFAVMSHRQRVVAYTARYAPRLLPFVLRAGISQINGGGTDRFMQSLYANAPIDMGALDDPEIRRVVLQGYQFATLQGHFAFEIDSYHVVRDWSDLTTGADVPVVFVHGTHDPVVSSQSVRDFAERLGNRASVSIFDDAGQLVLHQFPDRVLDAVAKLAG